MRTKVVYGKKGRGPLSTGFGADVCILEQGQVKKQPKAEERPIPSVLTEICGNIILENFAALKIDSPAPKKRHIRSQKLKRRVSFPRISPSPPQSLLKPQFSQRLASIDGDTTEYVKPLATFCSDIEDFQGWADERIKLLGMIKIGEGSYGEVYRATNKEGESAIFKLLPLRARKGVGSKIYTRIEDAANEVQLLQKMSEVPGFVEFRGACLLHGPMPKHFVSEWKAYLTTGRTVESRDPSRKNAYPPTQLWLAIEMSDAGEDLSQGHYTPPRHSGEPLGERYLSIQRTWDIFWQIVRALTLAEIHASFEHRDLHLGNICIKETRSQIDTEDCKFIPRNRPTPFKLDHTGVQASLIDYTLSRATVAEDRILFSNIGADKDLMNHPEPMYRDMAKVLSPEGWGPFSPKTNLVWISRLLKKMLEVTKEPSEEARREEEGKITVTATMLMILEEVRDMTSVERWEEWMVGSAESLVTMGVERGWFLIKDVLKT
ncbi:MAG: hypothetical protein MMC33_008266 [Icmadophila ericetorum]|nr:hypothetical protein [Icmadophila ericetorum]